MEAKPFITNFGGNSFDVRRGVWTVIGCQESYIALNADRQTVKGFIENY